MPSAGRIVFLNHSAHHSVIGDTFVSDYQSTLPSEEISTSASAPKPWLWVGLFGIMVCMIVVAIPAGIAGWAYTRLQNDSATATAQAVLPPPGWSLTIDEQFVSSKGHWGIGSFESEFGTAKLSIENGLYQWQAEANSRDGSGWWEFPVFDHRLDDFYASVDCRQIDGDIAGANYGLVFRFLNDDNYFYFFVADDQLMRIGLRREGMWSDTLPWKHTELVRPGEVNRIAILAEGTRYKFYINSTLAYVLDDDQFSGGRVGLIVELMDKNKAEFQFDNLQLYEPVGSEQ